MTKRTFFKQCAKAAMAAVAFLWIRIPDRKVICVDDSNISIRHECPDGAVVKGETYTNHMVRRTGGLYIMGKPVFVDGEEVAWRPHRFKRVGASLA